MATTFYRVMSTDPPSRQDFMSKQALGMPLRRAEDQELLNGLSCQATEQQAYNRARIPGCGVYIAQLWIPDDGDILWRRTTNSRGHHTLWGDPDELLACVVSTLPV